MNPIIFTLILMSIATVGGIITVKKECRDRIDQCAGVFFVSACFVLDGILVAALL